MKKYKNMNLGQSLIDFKYADNYKENFCIKCNSRLKKYNKHPTHAIAREY